MVIVNYSHHTILFKLFQQDQTIDKEMFLCQSKNIMNPDAAKDVPLVRPGDTIRGAAPAGEPPPEVVNNFLKGVSSSTPQAPVSTPETTPTEAKPIVPPTHEAKPLTSEEQVRMTRLGTTTPPPTPEQLRDDINKIAADRAAQTPKPRI